MTLYPIRIDVSSIDKQVRIIDTMLIDTSNTYFFPSIISTNNSSNISTIASELAYNIVSDSQVQGMNRSGGTGKHFTGRMDLIDIRELWPDITKQIEVQLRSIQQNEVNKKQLLLLSGQEYYESNRINDNARKKKKQEENDGDDDHNNDNETPARKKQKSTTTTTKNNSNNNLIPIRLRLSVHGVRIHDDFDWDPNLEDSVQFGPIQMAQCIAYDLHLSQEAIQAIAIEIIEQIEKYYNNNEKVLDDTITQKPIEKDEGGPTQRTNISAAWELTQKVHVTNVAHLVAHHKGSSTSQQQQQQSEQKK